MDTKAKENIASNKEAKGSIDPMKAFWDRVNGKLGVEFTIIEKLSKKELIKYAAETRVYMVELQNQQVLAFEAIALQQEMINRMAEVINALIDKKPVTAIDIAMGQVGQFHS